MTDPWDDDTLLAALGRVLRSEPPPEVLDGAKDQFRWRTLDAELAQLTYDSLLDDEHALARAADQPRILTFEIASLVIEVEIDSSPSGRRLLGQVVPPATAGIELLPGDGGPAAEALASTRSDALGRFVLPLPSRPGLVAMRCTLADGSSVETARTRM